MKADSPWKENPDIFKIPDGTPHVSDMHAMAYLISKKEVNALHMVGSAERAIVHIKDNCVNQASNLYGSARRTPLAIHFSREAMRMLTEIHYNRTTIKHELHRKFRATIQRQEELGYGWRDDKFRFAILKDVMMLIYPRSYSNQATFCVTD